jgi:hypothetical protein
MMKPWLAPIALIVVLAHAIAGPARAWDGDGHRVVAAIAFSLLPPQKGEALDRLLRGSRVGRGFVDASGYADDVLRQGPAASRFAPWHYLSWPTDEPEPAADACAKGCVIETLLLQLPAGADRRPHRRETRALALSWVLHLVGDMHQPLHVGDRRDRGGNGFPVDGQPIENLHKVWDELLVERLAGGRHYGLLARDLSQGLTTWRGHPAAAGNPRTWLVEAHALVEPYAYAGITQGQPVPEAYIQRALPIVSRQLLYAGIRLARLVDENF